MFRIYKTISGDTWDGIAYKLYKDERRMVELLKHNAHLGAVTVFDAGEEVRYKPDDGIQVAPLAPWRRGAKS